MRSFASVQYFPASSWLRLHSSSVVYICAHVLFVHLYAVIASVIVIVCVHARLVYLHVSHRDIVYENNSVHKNDSIHKHDSLHKQDSVFASTTLSSSAPQMPAHNNYSDLIKTLQAAKHANNII